jgi:hypothetical protein
MYYIGAVKGGKNMFLAKMAFIIFTGIVAFILLSVIIVCCRVNSRISRMEEEAVYAHYKNKHK